MMCNREKRCPTGGRLLGSFQSATHGTAFRHLRSTVLPHAVLWVAPVDDLLSRGQRQHNTKVIAEVGFADSLAQ